MVSDKVKYTSYEDDPKRILNTVKKFSKVEEETIISDGSNDFHRPYDRYFRKQEPIAPTLRDQIRIASETKQQILDRALERIIENIKNEKIVIGDVPMSMLFALAPLQADLETVIVTATLTTIISSTLGAFFTQVGQAMWGGAAGVVQRDPFGQCEKILKKNVSLPPGLPWAIDSVIFQDTQGSKLCIGRGAPQSSYQSLLSIDFAALRQPFDIHWLSRADVWLAITYKRQGNKLKEAFIWQPPDWKVVLSS
jgi:hypothetical protein